MSMRRMFFILVLAAAVAIPAAAADLKPTEVPLGSIFADPEVTPAPAPGLLSGEKAEPRSTCFSEGEKVWIWNGSCCVGARQSQDQYVCMGGVWVPTGSTRCFQPTCGS